MMKPVVVAKIIQDGILAPPTGFITRWTSNKKFLNIDVIIIIIILSCPFTFIGLYSYCFYLSLVRENLFSGFATR